MTRRTSVENQVVLVVLVLVSTVPPPSHGTELPSDDDWQRLDAVIIENKVVNDAITEAMRTVLLLRQSVGCNRDVYEAQKLVSKKAQLYARELAVTVITLYRETLTFKEVCRSQCQANEWRCKNGQCIPQSRRCDGRWDCSDASDEAPICLEGCGPNQFMCPVEQTCLPQWARCDALYHCSDGSDELCQSTCGYDEFLCYRDRRCVAFNWTCDGDPDCSDGADEQFCAGHEAFKPSPSQIMCGENKFLCSRDKTCIDARRQCDGILDCSDRSDERECSSTNTTETPATPLPTPPMCNEFRCASGDMCVSFDLLCDGYDNCLDGSDERNCPTPVPQRVCPANMFQCNSTSQCIYLWWQCDGYPECEDGSDEHQCVNGFRCGRNYFYCLRDDKCLDATRRCDGVTDCSDSSDEMPCPATTTSPTATTTTTTTTTTMPMPPTLPVCSAAEGGGFRCASGDMCVDFDVLCNGVANCFDGSDEDEQHCAMTTQQPVTDTMIGGVTVGIRFGEASSTPSLVPVTFVIPTTTIPVTTTTTTDSPTTTTTTITTTSTTSTPDQAIEGQVNEASCRARQVFCGPHCIPQRLACLPIALDRCPGMSRDVRSACQNCRDNGMNARTCLQRIRESTSVQQVKASRVQRCLDWGWSLDRCRGAFGGFKFHRG